MEPGFPLPGRQTGIALSGELGGLGIDPLEIGEHRRHRVAQVVHVEAVDAALASRVCQAGIVFPQPIGEAGDVGVPPHPRGEALEGRGDPASCGPVPDVSVDRGGIRPVRLDGHDREPVPLDEMARDGCPGPVELSRAVTGLPKQHDPGVREAIEQTSERRVIEERQWFGRVGDQIAERRVSGGAGPVGGPAREGRHGSPSG